MCARVDATREWAGRATPIRFPEPMPPTRAAAAAAAVGCHACFSTAARRASLAENWKSLDVVEPSSLVKPGLNHRSFRDVPRRSPTLKWRRNGLSAAASGLNNAFRRSRRRMKTINSTRQQQTRHEQTQTIAAMAPAAKATAVVGGVATAAGVGPTHPTVGGLPRKRCGALTPTAAPATAAKPRSGGAVIKNGFKEETVPFDVLTACLIAVMLARAEATAIASKFCAHVAFMSADTKAALRRGTATRTKASVEPACAPTPGAMASLPVPRRRGRPHSTDGDGDWVPDGAGV